MMGMGEVMSRGLMGGAALKFLVVAIGFLLAASGHASAQGAAPAKPAAKPDMQLGCPGLIASRPMPVVPAAFRLVALKADEVRLDYIGHSTFLIESPQQVRIATDYNDFVRPSVLPDIVTMNHAHNSHFTNFPDPAIKHVLRGWAGEEKPARIDMQYKDVRVRNVPTNIRTLDGGTERHGNSIFIFEIANLCIAHLGHLHHTLTQQQLNEIGKIDVVLVPVDGSYTLDLEGMIEVLKALNAPLMIPMHYFSSFTLNNFLARVRKEWEVEISAAPMLVVSKTTLPAKPKVLVLPGQ
jgi:L-ascorbate metabolism protein UlaG (beta-lactamase superfamily)